MGQFLIRKKFTARGGAYAFSWDPGVGTVDRGEVLCAIKAREAYVVGL